MAKTIIITSLTAGALLVALASPAFAVSCSDTNISVTHPKLVRPGGFCEISGDLRGALHTGPDGSPGSSPVGSSPAGRYQTRFIQGTVYSGTFYSDGTLVVQGNGQTLNEHIVGTDPYGGPRYSP